MQKWTHFYNIPTFQNRVEEIEDVNNPITTDFSFSVAIMKCWRLGILWRKKLYWAHSSEDSSTVSLERKLPGEASAWGSRGLHATRRNHTVSSEGKGDGLPCCHSLSQALTQGRFHMQDPSELSPGFGSTTFTHSHSGLSLASCVFQGLVVTHSLARVCLFLLLSSALQMVSGFLLSRGMERGGLTGLGDCSVWWAFLHVLPKFCVWRFPDCLFFLAL